jgi:hypothetical protein
MLTDNQRGMKADARSIGTTSAKLFSMIEEVGLVDKAANKDAESLSLDNLAKSDVGPLKALHSNGLLINFKWKYNCLPESIQRREESNC